MFVSPYQKGTNLITVLQVFEQIYERIYLSLIRTMYSLEEVHILNSWLFLMLQSPMGGSKYQQLFHM